MDPVVALADKLTSAPLQELTPLLAEIGVNTDLGRGMTPLSLTTTGPDLVTWLLDHGAERESSDYFGDRALAYHSRSAEDPLATRVLLRRGADPDATNVFGRTATHAAAAERAVGPLAELAAHGANLEAADAFGITPFSLALRTTPLSGLAELAATTRLFLDHGARTPPDAALHLARLAGDLARNPDGDGKASEILGELRAAFRVNEAFVNDGYLPVEMGPEEVDEYFRYLWSEHVPGRGKADDLRIEAIRVVGRIGFETLRNGGINWDDDFEQMLAAVLVYFTVGNPLPPDVPYTPLPVIQARLQGGGFDPESIDDLTRYAVNWYHLNRGGPPIAMPEIPYAR